MIKNALAKPRAATVRPFAGSSLLAVKREQLLGALLAAERPEASAATAGKNYGIEVQIWPQISLIHAD